MKQKPLMRRRNFKEIYPVVGRYYAVSIPGMEPMRFWAIKDNADNPSTKWFVIENDTGLAVGWGDTKKAAIDSALTTCTKHGNLGVKEEVEYVIKYAGKISQG